MIRCRPMFEAVIKINPSDPPERRARDIEEGIGYACTLLMDEYGYPAGAIENLLDRTVDAVYDEEESRAS
jgi:hypothetical protein